MDIQKPVSCDIDNIDDDCYDSHGGESFCSILAYNKEKLLIGYLDYSIFQQELNVKMIEVRNTCKRRGIATRLLQTAEEKGHVINMGFSTDEGALFLTGFYKKKKD